MKTSEVSVWREDGTASHVTLPKPTAFLAASKTVKAQYKELKLVDCNRLKWIRFRMSTRMPGVDVPDGHDLSPQGCWRPEKCCLQRCAEKPPPWWSHSGHSLSPQAQPSLSQWPSASLQTRTTYHKVDDVHGSCFCLGGTDAVRLD